MFNAPLKVFFLKTRKCRYLWQPGCESLKSEVRNEHARCTSRFVTSSSSHWYNNLKEPERGRSLVPPSRRDGWKTKTEKQNVNLGGSPKRWLVLCNLGKECRPQMEILNSLTPDLVGVGYDKARELTLQEFDR